MAEPNPSPGFAPNDPTDGRKLYEWESKYSPEAKRHIRVEAALTVGTLFAVPLVIGIIWHGAPKTWLGLDDQKYGTFARYCYAWLGGTLGGTLFDLKWLYHTVARGIWQLDRRLWRLLIPHISGGHAFAVVLLISSGFFRIFDVAELSRAPVVLGVGFLVGYFSDSAIGKLTEIANTLFGSTSSSNKRYPVDQKPPVGPEK
jgi:hypothetical protein